MGKNGFTLIELLAVILILGIIALIAIPAVSNLINDSEDEALALTTKQITEVISDKCNLDLLKGIDDTGTYSIINGTSTYSIDIKGKLPTNGKININDECEVEILTYEDNNCAYKNYDNDRVTIGNYENDSCKIENEVLNVEVLPNNRSCFIFDKSTGTITDYDVNNPSCQGAIVVPEKIDGINVTAIADGAFIADYDYLIQRSLFDGTEYTYDIYSPNSFLVPFEVVPVKNLSDALKKTCYAERNEENGVELFYNDDSSSYEWCKFNGFTLEEEKKVNTTGITSIDFSKAIHLTSIGAAVSSRSTLNKVTFGQLLGLNYIGPNAFDRNNINGTLDLSGLPALTALKTAIFHANNITDIIFNDNVTVIWHFAFDSNRIINLDLPENLQYILIQAFSFNDIRNLIIPDSVIAISNFAFYENLNMDTLALGSKITAIEKAVFYNCGLNTVDFSKANSLEILSYYAFKNNNLETIDVNSQYYYQEAFDNNNLKSVNIGNRVKGINKYTFTNNLELTSININSSYSSGSPWGAPGTCEVKHTN